MGREVQPNSRMDPGAMGTSGKALTQPSSSHFSWLQCLPVLQVFSDCSVVLQAIPCISSKTAVEIKLRAVDNFPLYFFLPGKRNLQTDGSTLPLPPFSSEDSSWLLCPGPRETQTIFISECEHNIQSLILRPAVAWMHGERVNCKTSLEDLHCSNTSHQLHFVANA